jgi:hypothetical protein
MEGSIEKTQTCQSYAGCHATRDCRYCKQTFLSNLVHADDKEQNYAHKNIYSSPSDNFFHLRFPGKSTVKEHFYYFILIS